MVRWRSPAFPGLLTWNRSWDRQAPSTPPVSSRSAKMGGKILSRDSALIMPRDTASQRGGAAVLVQQPQRTRKRQPLYRVLLHNDPVNTRDYVVATLQTVVPQLSEQDAVAVMLAAHNTGVGLVIVCDQEPAEFYSEQLKSKGLTSTIEPET